MGRTGQCQAIQLFQFGGGLIDPAKLAMQGQAQVSLTTIQLILFFAAKVHVIPGEQGASQLLRHVQGSGSLHYDSSERRHESQSPFYKRQCAWGSQLSCLVYA